MSGEKRSQDCEDTLHAETVIIVDIEGTTTSISFVKETLFPYVRENLKKYIEKNWETEEFKGDLEKLKEQAKKDETDKVEGVVSITGATPEEERESLIKNVLWQMDGDRKTGALKQLQGHVWREAYESGAVKGHVYEDVPKAFEGWTKSGRKIYVYSSGSVEAQKLLFGHSEHGDMTKYLTDYFDTQVGAKQESSSYKNILAKIDAEPSAVLFLTDVVKEAQAAKEAGLSAKIVVRPGNGPLTDEEKVIFTTIETFMDLSFQTSAKRQKVDKPDEKVTTAPEAAPAAEPMDTSEEVPDTSAENVKEKSIEKIVESKKTVETAVVEETKILEKSKVDSMDVDAKIETEKKVPEIADKPVVSEEAEKKEEESKSGEKSESSEKVATASEVAKEDGQVPKKDNEAAKSDGNSATVESKTSKGDGEIAKKDTETLKKDEEVAKKETAIAKQDKEAKKPEESAAASVSDATAKLESEPMDEETKVLPSKSEVSSIIKEDKTEVSAKSVDVVKAEQKIETKACQPVDTLNDKNLKNETDEKISSTKSESSTEKVAESAVEKKNIAETPTAVTTGDKVKPEVAPKTMETEVTTKSDDKPPAKDGKIIEDVQQNGDSETAKKDEGQSADKKESNGDSKEENKTIDQVATVAAVEATKVSSAVEKTEEEKEPVVESAKKDEKEAVDAKVKIDEITAVESADAKLNGTAEDTNKNESAKPHRNGLNGDSTGEKSNGDTQNEAASSSQNGEAESSTDAASSAESIKTKKVVDSTIVDAAGEPEVVPPVAVVATS